MPDDPNIPGERRRGADRRRAPADLHERLEEKRAAVERDRRVAARRTRDREHPPVSSGAPDQGQPVQPAPGRRRSDREGHSHASGRDLSAFPASLAEMREWVHDQLRLPQDQERALLGRFEGLLARQERFWIQSKNEAIDAVVAGFTARIARLREEVSERDATVSTITQYFESLVSELMARAHQDPKTHLINFARFMEQLEFHLGAEQRGRWCAVGLVDITSFKSYNDTLGHAVGDRIIQRVAILLREQVRAGDLLAHDSRTGDELHARFGGDEFCFLIPRLDDIAAAGAIADRFREAVAREDWAAVDPRLASRPVRVDVGVACLLLGSLAERRRVGPALAQELLIHADKSMYHVKASRLLRVEPVALGLQGGNVVVLDAGEGAY